MYIWYNFIGAKIRMLRKTGIFILVISAALSGCTKHYSVSKKEAQHQGLKSVSSSAKSDSIIAPYRNQLGSEMEKQLVICEGELTKDGTETTLGNFVCDALKWVYDSVSGSNTKTLVLLNRGGLRATISKGMVTVNSIYEVMPFDNELECVVVKGKDLEEIIKRILEKRHAFSGMVIHADKQGEYAVTVNGNALEADANYSLLCSDFLVNGGDGFTFGKNLV
jgi:2',3'-cyclic-nucleotide 2'-phosphodiesterase (5'-nucleotidase family)